MDPSRDFDQLAERSKGCLDSIRSIERTGRLLLTIDLSGAAMILILG